MLKWTICSQGDVDFLHAAVGQAIQMGNRGEYLDVFHADPAISRKQNFGNFLETSFTDVDTEVFFIYDNVYFKPYEPFKIIQPGNISKFSDGGLDLVFLSTVPIKSDVDPKRRYYGSSMGLIEDVVPSIEAIGALYVNQTGAAWLAAYLNNEPLNNNAKVYSCQNTYLAEYWFKEFFND